MIIKYILILLVIPALVFPDASIAQVVIQKISLPRPNLTKISLPQSIGRILEEKYYPSDNPVIIIQDSHCNYEAQQNIAKILQFLDEDIGFIAVEGAEGKVDLSLFNSIPDEKIKKDIAEHFLKEGSLSGSEYYSIFYNPDTRIYGVEDPKLYQQNLSAFKESKVNNKLLLDYVQRLEEYVEISKTDICSKLQLEYVPLYQGYHRGELNLTQYCKRLASLFGREIFLSFPQAEKVFTCIQLEEKIDFKKVETQRDAFIKHLTSKCEGNDKTKLMQMVLYLKLNRISPFEFYEYLSGLLGYSVINEFSDLNNYVELIKMQEGMDINLINNELGGIESIIFEKYFVGPLQKKFINNVVFLDILDKLAHLNLSRKELNFYTKCRRDFISPIEGFDSIRENIGEIEKFYLLAVKRDKILANNFIKAVKNTKNKSSVLITGGFHTDGIKNILKDLNMPYLVISPNISKPSYYETYLKAVFREKDNFSKLLENTGARLSPVMTGANGLSDPMELRLMEKEVGILQLSLIVPNMALVKKLGELKNAPVNESTQRQIKIIQNLILKEARRIFKEFINKYIAGKSQEEKERINRLFSEDIKLMPKIEIDEGEVKIFVEIEDKVFAVSIGSGGKGTRIGSYTVNMTGQEQMEFVQKPHFPLKAGDGELSKEAGRYIEGQNGRQFLERVFQAKEFGKLKGGIKYVKNPCLMETNTDDLVCEVNEKIVAVISFLLNNRLITEDSAKEFYRFLLHHEQAHAVLSGKGYMHEFIIHLGDYFRLTRDEVDKIRFVFGVIRDQKEPMKYVLGNDVVDYEDIGNIIEMLDAYSIILDSADKKDELNDYFQLFLGTLIGHLSRFHPEVSVYQDIKELVGMIRERFGDFLLEYISRGNIEYQSLSIFISLFEFMRAEGAKRHIIANLTKARDMAVEDKVAWASGVLNEFSIFDQSLRLSIVSETVLTRGKYANALSKLFIEFPVTDKEAMRRLEENMEFFKSSYAVHDLEVLTTIVNSIFGLSLNPFSIQTLILPKPKADISETPLVEKKAEEKPPEIKKTDAPAEKKPSAKSIRWPDSLERDLAAIITKEVDNWDNPPAEDEICERVMKSPYLLTHPRLRDVDSSEIKAEIHNIIRSGEVPYKDPMEEKIKELKYYDLFCADKKISLKDEIEIIQRYSSEFVETLRDLGRIDVYQLDQEEREIIQEYIKKTNSSCLSEAKEYAERLINYIKLRNTKNRYVYFQFLSYQEEEYSEQSFEESAKITALSGDLLNSLQVRRIFMALMDFQRYNELCKDSSLNKVVPYIIRDFTNISSNQPFLDEIKSFIARSGNIKLQQFFLSIVLGGEEVEFIRFLYIMPTLEEMEPSEKWRESLLSELQSIKMIIHPNELRRFQIDLANLIKLYKSSSADPKIYRNACFLEEIARKSLPDFSKIYKEETSSVPKLMHMVDALAVESIRGFISKNPSIQELKSEMDKGPAYRNAYLRCLVDTDKDRKPELVETIIGCMTSPYEITAFLHSWDFEKLDSHMQNMLSSRFGELAKQNKLAGQIDDIISRSYFQFLKNVDFFIYTAIHNSSFREYLIGRILNAQFYLPYYCLLIYFQYLSNLGKEARIQEINVLIKNLIGRKGYSDIVLLDIIFINFVKNLEADDQARIINCLIDELRGYLRTEKSHKLSDLKHFKIWLRHFVESVNYENKKVVIDLNILDSIDLLIQEVKTAESCEDIINKYGDLNGPFSMAKSKEIIERNKDRIREALGEMGGINIYMLSRAEKDNIIRLLDSIFNAKGTEDARPFIEELKGYIKTGNTENRYLFMTFNIDPRIWTSKIPALDCTIVKKELLETSDLLDKYYGAKGVGFIQVMLDIQRFLEAINDVDPEQKIPLINSVFPKAVALLISCREFHSIVTLSGNIRLKNMFSDNNITVSRKETGDFFVWYFMYRILDLVPAKTMKEWTGLEIGEKLEAGIDASVLLQGFEQMAVLFKLYPEEIRYQLTAVFSAMKTIERTYDSYSPQCRLLVLIRQFMNGCFNKKLLKELEKKARVLPYITELTIEGFKVELDKLNTGVVDEAYMLEKYSSSPAYRIFLVYQYALLSTAMPDKRAISRLKLIIEDIVKQMSSPYEISALFLLAVPGVLPEDLYSIIKNKFSQFMVMPDTRDEIFHNMLSRSFDNYLIHSSLILLVMEKGKDFNPLINFIVGGNTEEYAIGMQALFSFLKQRGNPKLILDVWKALIESNGLMPQYKTQFFFIILLNLITQDGYKIEFTDLWNDVCDFYNRKLSEGDHGKLNVLAFSKMIQGVILQYYPLPPSGYEPERIQEMAEELIRQNITRPAGIAASKIQTGKEGGEEPPCPPRSPEPPAPKGPPLPPEGDDLSSFLGRDDLEDSLKNPGNIWKQDEFEIDTDESGIAFIPYKYKGQQRMAFIQTQIYESNIIIKPQFYKEDLFSEEGRWVFSVHDIKNNPVFVITIEASALDIGLNPFYRIEEVLNQVITDWIEGYSAKPKPFFKNVVVTKEKGNGVPRNAGFDLCHGFRKKYRIRIIRGVLSYIKRMYQQFRDDAERFEEMRQVLVKPQEVDPLNKYVEVYGKNGDFIGRYWIVKDGEIKTGAIPEVLSSEEEEIRRKLTRFHSHIPKRKEIVVGGIRKRLPGRRRQHKQKMFEREEYGYNVNYLFSWAQIQELADFYGSEGKPVKRLFLDLDEVVLRPKGFLASDKWMAQMVNEHGYYKAKKEWRSHEERMINARFFELVEPEIRNIIQRLKNSYGMDIVLVTARGREDYERTREILATLDIEVDKDVRLVCAGGGGICKVKAIQQYIESRGDIKEGEINMFIDDRPYSVAVVEDKCKGVSAGDVFSYCYTNPKDYESMTVEEYLSLAKESEERGNLEDAKEYFLNAQEYYLNLLEYSRKVTADLRLEIYRNISIKIEELREKGIDVTALLLSFLPKATGFIKDMEEGNIDVLNESQFEEFLSRWFSFYFINHGTFFKIYKYKRREGLAIGETLKQIVPVIVPTALNQGRFQEYEIEINENNLYLFLEPAMEYIARAKPDVAFVMDTGSRPFLEPLKHFITRCGLSTKVALIPVSYKNVGDTEFEVNRLLNKARELKGESDLTEEQRVLAETIGDIFPLTDKRILIIDDNVVSGGTITLMENVLAKYGISALATATPMRFNSDNLGEDVISTFKVCGSYSWKQDRPSVTVIPCWDQDGRRHLRGVIHGRRFGGFMREPLTGNSLREAQEFHNKLMSNFKQALKTFGGLIVEIARQSAIVQPDKHYDMTTEEIVDILIEGRQSIMKLLTSTNVNAQTAVERLLEVAEDFGESLDIGILTDNQIIRKILLELDIYPAVELIDFLRTGLMSDLAKKDKQMRQAVSDFWDEIRKRRDMLREGETPSFASPLDRAIYFKNTFMKYEQYLNIINLYLRAEDELMGFVPEGFGEMSIDIEGFSIKLAPARGLEDFLNNYTVMEDQYGDQLFYPDFISYNIEINGIIVGRVNLLNLIDENNPLIKVLYFKNFQLYESFPQELDVKVFVDLILEKVKELHDRHNYSFMLIPPAADIYQFSRNQDVRRYFEDRYRWGATTASSLSLAEVDKLLGLSMQDRSRHYKSIKTKLDILKTGFVHWQNALYQSSVKFLMPGLGDKPLVMLTPGQLKPLSEGFIRLMNWRFEATKNGYPPIIIHKKLTEKDIKTIAEWEKEEELLARVLFDENERKIFDSICKIKRLNEELHSGQERFYKRLWDRVKVGKVDKDELSDWQAIVMRDIMISEIEGDEPHDSEKFNFTAFLKNPSNHIENWPPGQRSRRLMYQAVELYEGMRLLKQQGEIVQTPVWFYEGEDGRERGKYLAQYLVKEILKGKNILNLTRRDFTENGLTLLWDRVFHRDIYEIAEAVYPGQFKQDEEGNTTPKPLTLREVEQFIEGTLELAVGRSYKGEGLGIPELSGVNFILIENDPNQGIVLNVYRKQGEEQILLVTYKKRELKNGACKINLSISDIIDFCSGREGVFPGKEIIIKAGMSGEITITEGIILSDTGIPDGEKAILKLEEDMNHGTILNIYRCRDNKLSGQYLYINGIKKVDIAMYDLFSYFFGTRKIKLRREIKVEISKKVSDDGKLELSYLDKTIEISIPFLAGKTALVKFENDENEGPVINIYDFEKHNTLFPNLIYPEKSYLFKQAGIPSQETDLRLKSIIYCVYGISNVFGYETVPDIFFSTESVSVPIKGSAVSFSMRFADKTLSFDVPAHLIGKRIAMVPQRHHQQGYIFEIHDLEEYITEPFRPCDMCLMRDKGNNTLVPYKGHVVSVGEQQEWLNEAQRVVELYGDFIAGDNGDVKLEQLFGLILGKFPRMKRENLHRLVRALKGHVKRIKPSTGRKKPAPKNDGIKDKEPVVISLDEEEEDLVREFTEILINNNYKKIEAIYKEDENKARQYILNIFDESMTTDKICKTAMIRAKKILSDAIDFDIRGILPGEIGKIELYQRINLIYLLDRDSLYFSDLSQRYPNKIIADDPGLGKTLEIILYMLNVPIKNANGSLKVALVVPNASKEQELWIDELNKWVTQRTPIEIKKTSEGAVYIKIPQAALDGRDIEIILYNYEALRVTLAHGFDVYSQYLRVSGPAVENADLERENELIEQFFRDLQRLDPSLLKKIEDMALEMYWKVYNDRSSIPKTYFQKKIIRALNVRLSIYNQAAKEVKDMCENLIQKADIDWINEPERVKDILWEKVKQKVDNICELRRIKEDEETKWIDNYLQNAFFAAVRKRYERLRHVQKFNPDVLIIDEAHTIRSETTLTTLSVRAINAARKLYLTATPLVGRDHKKLFTQLSSLYPGIFTKDRFNMEFPNEPQGAGRLSKFLSRFMIRREAKDVTNLPSVGIEKERVELEGVEKEVSDITEEVVDEYFAAMSSGLTQDEIRNRMLRVQQASCGLFVLSEYIAQLKLMKAVRDRFTAELQDLVSTPLDQFKSEYIKLIPQMKAIIGKNMPNTENLEQLIERTIKEIELRIKGYISMGKVSQSFSLLNPKEERILDITGRIPKDYIPAKMKKFAEIAEDVLGRVHLTSPDRKTILTTLKGKRISRPAQWSFSLYTKDGRHIQDFEARVERDIHGAITGVNFLPMALPENISPSAIDMQKADIRGRMEWDDKIKGEKKKNNGLLYDMQNLLGRLHDENTFEDGAGYSLTIYNGKVVMPIRFNQQRIGSTQIKVDPELVSAYGLQRDDICIFPRFYPINGVMVTKGKYDDVEIQEDMFIPVTHKEININGETYPIVFEKLAVLSRFVSVARRIREIFAHHGVSYVAEEVSDRLGELNKFRVDPSVPVYIGTTDQNYQALSLVTNKDLLPHHVARTMVLYDLHWQPLDQISLRMRRQGQYWPVKIHILMGNTADESRFFDVSEKREVQQLIIGGRISLEGRKHAQEKTFIALKILFAKTQHLLRTLKRETFNLSGRNPSALKERFNGIAQEQIDVVENTPMFTQSIATQFLCLPFIGRYISNPKPNFGFDSRLSLKERMALKKLKFPYKGEAKLDVDKDIQIQDLDFLFQTCVRQAPGASEEMLTVKSPLRDKSLDVIFSEILGSIPLCFIAQVLAEYERVLNNHGILALSLGNEYGRLIVKILTKEYGFELISSPGQKLMFSEDILDTVTDADSELIERLKSDLDENTQIVVLRKIKDKQRDLMGVKTDSFGIPLPAEYQRYLDELARIFDIYIPEINAIQARREMFSLPKPYPVDLRELSYDGIRLLPKMKAEPVKTLKPGSPQMARRIVTKYFSDGRGFTLKKYLICLDKEGYMVSKDTARRDLKKLEKAGLVRIDRRKSPHNFIYLGKERYNKLAQRVVPLLLEEADTRSLLRVLPREGTREIDTAGLLRQIKEDSKGSIAAQILDVFLCDNALSVANIPKGIKLKEYEIEIIKDAVLRLNRQKLKGQLSDVIDKIMTEFGDDLGEVIVRTSLARLLNEAEGQIDTNYILVDIDRLDAGKFNDVSKIIERLNQLKLDSKKFVKIVWSSHRIKSYEELKGFVEGLFGKKDLEGDIFVSNPDELLPERFVGRLMQILEAKHIPIYEIVGLIAPENSHIYAGLEIVKRSFQKVKITLSPVEYEQLKPFLPEGMDSYIKYEDGCYTIEFNTLEDNLTEIIELLKQGQENLSHMA